NQPGRRLDGRRRVGSTRFQFQAGAAFRGHGGQTQDALAVDFGAVVADPDLGLEPRCQLHELLGGPHVQAQTIGNLDLATGNCRLVAHQRLDRPGPGTHWRPPAASECPAAASPTAAAAASHVDAWSASSKTSMTFSRDWAWRKKLTKRSSFKC